MERTRIAGVTIAALLSAACATEKAPVATLTPPTQTPSPTHVSAPTEDERKDEELATIYQGLEEGKEEFNAAVEQVKAGADIESLIAAQETINHWQERCEETDGCELSRFMEAQRAVLSFENELLREKDARIAELEAPQEGLEELGAEPPEAISPPQETFTVNDSLEDIIDLNGPIARGVLTWVGQRRPDFIEAWTNWKLLEEDLKPIYNEAGYPWELGAAQKFQESHVKAHAGSRRGAVGTDQFIRATGRKYGLRVVQGFDERQDPVKSTRAQIAYMQDLLKIFDGDYSLALAAYNGASAYRAAMRARRKNPKATFWDREVYLSSRRETRDYVALVLAAAMILREPERFGFTEPAVDTRRAELELARDTTIDQLAFCLGDDPRAGSFGFFRALRNMNPQYSVKDTLPKGTTLTVPAVAKERYVEHCIGGAAVELAARLHEHAFPEYETYRVRRGDTLQKIGRRYGVRWGDIARENGIKKPYVIHPGDVLIIPQD